MCGSWHFSNSFAFKIVVLLCFMYLKAGFKKTIIDESGEFKELLDEVIKKAFNPDLRLFKVIKFLFSDITSYLLWFNLGIQ